MKFLGSLFMGNIESKNAKLVEAAWKGQTDIVQELLAGGVRVNATDKDGRTALITASAAGYIGIVRLLLAKGANVNARTKSGGTALMVAAGGGHTAVVQLLLGNGADTNAKVKEGTALIFAALQGHVAVVEALLEKGADVNGTNQEGSTALSLAAWDGHIAVIRALLANGADVNARSKSGETALMVAAERGHIAIVQLLKGSAIPKEGRREIQSEGIDNEYKRQQEERRREEQRQGMIHRENLIRWQRSGQPGLWVKEHKGQWDHEAWLSLLETLRSSSFWPMEPDGVGRVLEQLKIEYWQSFTSESEVTGRAYVERLMKIQNTALSSIISVPEGIASFSKVRATGDRTPGCDFSLNHGTRIHRIYAHTILSHMHLIDGQGFSR